MAGWTKLTKLDRRCVSLLLLAAMLPLAGCTNLHDDSRRTRTEGAAAGAVAGWLLGGGLGALLGRGKNRKAAMLGGALAGAVAGGLAGRAYGDSVAKKKEGYARGEDALAARLASARRQTAEHRAYNAELRRSISRKQEQLAAVRAAGAPPGSTVAEFDLRTSTESQLAETAQSARSWQQAIDAHKAAVRTSADEARAAALEREVEALAEQRGELLRTRERLIWIGERLKP